MTKTRKQVVYLDMDGTIADLYGQADWLKGLREEKKGLFIGCKPLTTERVIRAYFPTDKYDVRICSMTPMDASDEYCKAVIAEKNAWLDEYFPSIKHRVFKKYGHNKNLRNCEHHILVDDSDKVRETFKGLALYPMWLQCQPPNQQKEKEEIRT